MHTVVNDIARRFTQVRQPGTGRTPEQVSQVHEAIDLDRPLDDVAAALEELHDVYLNDAVWFHDPKYLAHLNCPVVIPAVAAEAFNAAINTSVDTWDQSAGATHIEQRVIDWTCGRIGYDSRSDGVFTSGGTQSNLQALFLAREEAQRRWGMARIGDFRIFTSELSHFSLVKAARILGLGADAVVAVSSDERQRMDPTALKECLVEATDEGKIPMAVIATAGTTDFGSIDPLYEVAELAEAYAGHFHVDAAYGCGLLVSPQRRHSIGGIERADSVTVDFHKSFFQPVSSSALLVKEGRQLGHVTYYADYLNPESSAEPNLVDKSLQTTRRFDALKLWLTLRTMGADAIGRLFDDVCDLADEVWTRVEAHPTLETVTPASELSTLVFRVPGDDETQRRVRRELAADGSGAVAATTYQGKQVLKLTLLNPLTRVDDVMGVLDRLVTNVYQGPR
ncbi:pyridoxal-dependent decarboxylase [Haloglycomyces albus]|uniref:pyridoxal-dependent decarboxylase n=1 Tax=Haloglycomyces albus TaxID=526067 RepID=UPI000687CDF6